MKYDKFEKIFIVLSLEKMQLHLNKSIHALIRHLGGKHYQLFVCTQELPKLLF